MKYKKKYIKKIDVYTLIVHFLAIVILVFISIGALRQNNLEMLRLREEVFKADELGDGVESALLRLRDHVTSHMNTDLPKLGSEKAIQLKYSYERAANLEQKRYQDESAKLSQQARDNCAGISAQLSKVECEEKYIKENAVDPLVEIRPELYSIEFVSPRWSFDLAGWLIIATGIVSILFVARVAAIVLSVKYLKNYYL